jgi:hypothetical protein
MREIVIKYPKVQTNKILSVPVERLTRFLAKKVVVVADEIVGNGDAVAGTVQLVHVVVDVEVVGWHRRRADTTNFKITGQYNDQF